MSQTTPLKLLDLIAPAKIDLGDYKIHLATSDNTSPLQEFDDGTFQQWQDRQHQRNFQCEHVLALIHLETDKWFFAGIWKRLGVTQNPDGARYKYQYQTEEVAAARNFAGTLVTFNRTFRASYIHGWKYGDKLVVDQAEWDRMSMGDDSADDLPGVDLSAFGSDGADREFSMKSGLRRNLRVRKVVLDRGNGTCERAGCGQRRDFPGFLDVHHIFGAEKSDRIWTCVALCPNCHREAHFSPKRDELNAALLTFASQWDRRQEIGGGNRGSSMSNRT